MNLDNFLRITVLLATVIPLIWAKASLHRRGDELEDLVGLSREAPSFEETLRTAFENHPEPSSTYLAPHHVSNLASSSHLPDFDRNHEYGSFASQHLEDQAAPYIPSSFHAPPWDPNRGQYHIATQGHYGQVMTDVPSPFHPSSFILSQGYRGGASQSHGGQGSYQSPAAVETYLQDHNSNDAPRADLYSSHQSEIAQSGISWDEEQRFRDQVKRFQFPTSSTLLAPSRVARKFNDALYIDGIIKAVRFRKSISPYLVQHIIKKMFTATSDIPLDSDEAIALMKQGRLGIKNLFSDAVDDRAAYYAADAVGFKKAFPNSLTTEDWQHVVPGEVVLIRAQRIVSPLGMRYTPIGILKKVVLDPLWWLQDPKDLELKQSQRFLRGQEREGELEPPFPNYSHVLGQNSLYSTEIQAHSYDRVIHPDSGYPNPGLGYGATLSHPDYRVPGNELSTLAPSHEERSPADLVLGVKAKLKILGLPLIPGYIGENSDRIQVRSTVTSTGEISSNSFRKALDRDLLQRVSQQPLLTGAKIDLDHSDVRKRIRDGALTLRTLFAFDTTEAYYIADAYGLISIFPNLPFEDLVRLLPDTAVLIKVSKTRNKNRIRTYTVYSLLKPELLEKPAWYRLRRFPRPPTEDLRRSDALINLAP